MNHSGIAQRGEGRGRALGFPTVNIPLSDTEFAGIYAARVVTGGKEYFAAAYADRTRKLLELHLLDFVGDVYGQEITATVEKKIRDDARFDDEETLKVAIAKDVHAVREYYKV